MSTLALKTKFPFGCIVITPAAKETISDIEVRTLLMRHGFGDWGDICEEDKKQNETNLKTDGRLFSSYNLSQNRKIWIITEWDRSYTTILLPSDY